MGAAAVLVGIVAAFLFSGCAAIQVSASADATGAQLTERIDYAQAYAAAESIITHSPQPAPTDSGLAK